MDESRRTGRWLPASIPPFAVTRALLALLLLVALPACAVRLIAERDEVVVAKVERAHERLETLFLSLEDAALTPDAADGGYAAHAQTYLEVLVVLRGAEVHAGAVPRNEITVEQIGLLRDSVQLLRDRHRQSERELSVDLLRTLREPMVQQVRAILTLQRELER